MSVDYAAGLSHCDDLGDCGLDELFEAPEEVARKARLLAGWLREAAGSCVVHAGAGLSTAAGIRDFRGRTGVWTEMQRGGAKNETSFQCEPSKPFDETKPTSSHLLLVALCRRKLVRHIVSQNVDGLFLKAGLERRFISELHGNFYLDECTRCRARFVRSSASPTMCLTRSSNRCPRLLQAERACTGYLRDTILDWESSIPCDELRRAQREARLCKLHLCIGTSLQLSPSKDLVARGGRGKKLVIINLQPTKFDQHADLVIHCYADRVMELVASQLDLEPAVYEPHLDPTKRPEVVGTRWLR